jgi:hypothetical protein
MAPSGLALRGAVARRVVSRPGGLILLEAIRRLFRLERDVARFVRNPVRTVRRRRRISGWTWSDEDVAAIATRIEEDRPILSSNRLAGRCRYVYRQGGSFIVHDDVEREWYFVKTSDVHEFFASHAPRHEFVLFTGHTDEPVYGTHRRYLRRFPQLKAWFAMNCLIRHPRVFARPFGLGTLAQPEHTATLRRVQERQLPKQQLFHSQFMIERNPFERAYCLQETGIPLSPWRPWPEYLEELASSYFCISPSGIGLDCVRTWEALLVRTIPVVRRSPVTEQHRDYPMIVLDDWAQFRSIDFSPELYERTWDDWDPDELLLDRYLQRVERILESLG